MKRKKTHQEFEIKFNSIHSTIQLLEEYKGATERITVECTSCGKIWTPKAYSLLQGKGCPHCSAVRGSKNNKGETGTKNTETFINQLKCVNESIEVLGNYNNTHQKIKCRCKRCNHVWEAKPYSLLHGHGCPRCAKSGTSFMEQFILESFRRVFGEALVLSRDKSIIEMELDIVIPSMKFAVEPGNWALHKPHIERDIEKRKRCEERGITLITIYDNYPSDIESPFEMNCFTYKEDLNKSERIIIEDLVYKLLELMGTEYSFSQADWSEIEKIAYDSSRAMLHNDFIARMQLIHPSIEVIDQYKNSNRRIKVRCKECGHEWMGVPANMLSGDGCKKCGTIKAHETTRKSDEDFRKEVFKANPDIDVIGSYISRHKPIAARCKICGYEWTPIASSLLRGSMHKGWKTKHKELENNK